jgi:hypothetical protein
MLLKWVREFIDGLEKHNPRLRRMPFSRPWDRLRSAIDLGLQDLIKNLIGGMMI